MPLFTETVVDAAHLTLLRDRVASAAESEGVLDVSYRTLDSPIGELLIAATLLGAVRVAFASEGFDEVLGELSSAISPRVLRSGHRTDEIARQLDEYFAGRRRDFDLDVDLRLVAGFRRDVVAHLRDIAYGETESYADVARAVGNPGAVRAVGSACARNPLPLLLPCHRVVRSDGTMGQYRGGPEAKATLLAMEAA